MSSIVSALTEIRHAMLRSLPKGGAEPRLVAVSKSQSLEHIRAAYAAGHRSFGENYVAELVRKAGELPADIMWHFIGHLQSNKCKDLLSVPNVYLVETVDSVKLANKLNAVATEAGRPPLPVFVQVRTSEEASKHGVTRTDSLQLIEHVLSRCPQLRFRGLMTIGAVDDTPEPKSFKELLHCREQVASLLSIHTADIELSMGMSADFERAVRMGSTSIRVGSAIFGSRVYA
eukprot:GILK01009723.1.p1 GENE.GILK01009723.1~~GILK01009723.1.p1  ORF type:complete len:231 (+),score=13.91 GILK01009723.1:27-719(+)